ncbi:hypothetical protein QUF50_08095 [Thiotrichales bacterium HSG1]|nr:hypothetical protein [Thiotrichales bacterium HSG1]
MRSIALLLILANISLLFWQLKLLPWFPLLPEQFAPQVIRPEPKIILGLPSLILLGEQKETVTKNTIVTDIVEKVSLKSLPRMTTEDKVEDILNNDKMTIIATKILESTANIKVDDKVTEKIIYTCFRTGPYTEISTAKKVMGWLKEKKITVDLNQQVDKKLLKTQVYLSPFRNLQEAKRIQEHLYKVGIKEHYIFGSGPKNTISLGVYKIPSNAAIRVEELKAKGYNNVKIKETFKKNINYWLNIKMLSDDLIGSFNKKFKNFTLTSVACESIALQQLHKLGETTLLNK